MQTLKDMDAQIIINSQENVGTEINLTFRLINKRDVWLV